MNPCDPASGSGSNTEHRLLSSGTGLLACALFTMGKVLLITGSTGIAEATALKAAQQGDSVFVISRDESHCRSLSARLPGSGYHACDLRDEHAVEQALKACLEKFHVIDAVFNVAGISGRQFGDGPLHECSTEG